MTMNFNLKAQPIVKRLNKKLSMVEHGKELDDGRRTKIKKNELFLRGNSLN